MHLSLLSDKDYEVLNLLLLRHVISNALLRCTRTFYLCVRRRAVWESQGGNSNTKFVLGFCGEKLTLLSTFKIYPKHQHTLQPAALTFREGILKYACLICTETV